MPRRPMTTPLIVEAAELPPAPVAFDRLRGAPYRFFLDSALTDRRLGRYSFVGCDPFLVFRSTANRVTLTWKGGVREEITADPFAVLKSLMACYALTAPAAPAPFVSGGVGYFAYDLKDHIEDLPDTAAPGPRIPDCIVGFYDALIAYDHGAGRQYLVSSGFPESAPDRMSARRTERLTELKSAAMQPAPRPVASSRLSGTKAPAVRSNFSKAGYRDAVRQAQEYIRRGDIYQVNLSQRFEADLTVDPDELYRRLRTMSPAPFAAYLDFDGVAILSSSPERFLLKKGNRLETRPIKGTRPRGKRAAADRRLGRELVASAKDRAEHIMIVDLERNDLGRVCTYGSVKPSEISALEAYANVFHLVSTVGGTVRKGVDALDCLRAAFPGGSITGAPKIRSMEIIEELEGLKRSVYTGALGYLSFDGTMDTSIVIRTFIVQGEKVFFSVGGGIVADSDPAKEYEETLDKAAGLMQALGLERGGARCAV